MQSKNLTQPDMFDFRPARTSVLECPISTILACETRRDAINLAVERSGLSYKQIYGPLGIDSSRWNRILTSRDAHFPDDEQWLNFLKLTNNYIPPIWDLEKCGFDTSTLRRHGTDLEKENERLRLELADTKRSVKLLVEALPK